MSKQRTVVNAVILVAFAALCIGAMEWLAFNIGQGFKFGLPDNSYKMSGYFQDADGLPTAADVRVAGMLIGKVTGVGKDAAHPGLTKVEMSITDQKVSVHSNAFAKVRPKTLLGEKYVDLNPGTGDHDLMPTGAQLTNTDTTVENDTVFNSFDAQTRDKQKQVIQELNVALAAREGDIQAILPQLDAVVRNLDPVARVYEKDNAVVDQIFTNTQTVMQALADEHAQLGGFLSNGNQALKAIADRDNSLIATMQQLSQFDQRLNRVVTATVADQKSGIDKLTPALDSQHAFIATIIYPQAACGNKPCGLLQVLSGTLLGQINYPNDQLTVTGGLGPCGPGMPPTKNNCEGETVTNEWASMFSVPGDSVRTGSPNSHSALNIVLAEGCDTVATTTSPLTGISPALQSVVGTVCSTFKNRPPASTASATSGSANGAATAQVLSGLEGAWS